jgi:hypothetical protein
MHTVPSEQPPQFWHERSSALHKARLVSLLDNPTSKHEQAGLLTSDETQLIDRFTERSVHFTSQRGFKLET